MKGDSKVWEQSGGEGRKVVTVCPPPRPLSSSCSSTTPSSILLVDYLVPLFSLSYRDIDSVTFTVNAVCILYNMKHMKG